MSSNAPIHDDHLMTPTETAEYLGISTATLAKWRCQGDQPLSFIKAGRLIRYRVADVRAYLDARTRRIASES